MTRKGNRNVKVLKQHSNDLTDIRIEMTRKTRVNGEIIYAVVITDTQTGYHKRIHTYTGKDAIAKAFCLYKKAIA